MQFGLKQAQDLLEMFGGEEATIVVEYGDGHSGPGLYAYHEEYPEEGSVFLGDRDSAVGAESE